MADLDPRNQQNREPPPRSSVEKLDGLAELVGEIEPDDEETARLLQVAGALAPRLRSILPSDPERLDQMLLVLGSYALALRSDSAELPERTEQLLEVAL